MKEDLGWVDKQGVKVEEGRIKQISQAIGMEEEFMRRSIIHLDNLNRRADERLMQPR